MSNGHARLGPSNKRWPHCPGSVREEERYPDIAGEAAIDGTGSHLLLELCLQNSVQAIQYDQQIIGANHPDNMNGWLVAPDRCQRVQMALDYVERRVTELKLLYPNCNVTVESEAKSDPGGAFGRDDWWGTCDITIKARDPDTSVVYFIEVADYKDGRGYVSEKNNTQNISYLFGKLRQYVASGSDKCRPFDSTKVSGCRVTIIQPKTNPVVRYQCSLRADDGVSVSIIIESAEELAIAADKTDDPNAPLMSGDHCQWCKANPKRGGHCTAKTDKSLTTVDNMSTELVTTDNSDLLGYISKAVSDPKSLTVDQLSQLADAEEGFQAAFDKVKAEIQSRIEQGTHVSGYAMQPGRGSRVWNESEEIIVKKLKGRRLKQNDIYPLKLASPAVILKSDVLTEDQKKRIEKDLITFKAGKMSLKKVAHGVGQSSTDALQSDKVEKMFVEVPKVEPTAQEIHESKEISFF